MKKLIFILTCFYYFEGYSQGPWVYEKGNGYTHLVASTLYNYDKVFEGNLQNLADIEGSLSEFTAQSYSEYGFGNKLGATLSLPIRLLSSNLNSPTPSSREEGSIIGFGNIEVGLKYNILKTSVLVTASLYANLPTSISKDNIGLRTGYDALGISPIISLGKGFNRSYIYGYGGYEYNSNDFNNNLRFGIEYGYKFKDKLWTIISFNMKEPIAKTEKTFEAKYLETRSYINNQYYNSFALKLIYELKNNLGLNFSANLLSVRANNLPFKSPLAIGVYRKW